MVLGFFVGSMVLVPLFISLSSERRLHVPSEPLTTVSFLASSSVPLLPSTSKATTLHVPSICLRSFLIAASLASPAEAIATIAVRNTPTTKNPKSERFMLNLRGLRKGGSNSERRSQLDDDCLGEPCTLVRILSISAAVKARTVVV